jgi:cobalt-zinc-cadmium efflux system membrane fusion protein
MNMKDHPRYTSTHLHHGEGHRFAIAVLAGASVLVLVACSSGKGEQAQTSVTPHNVTLTAAQQQRIGLFTVTTSKFHTTVDTTGVVDFDHDQSTSVLAPFSGPVTKLLVTLGQKIRKGQALAAVASPDFAAAIGAYQKALAAASAADQLAATDRDLVAHHAISQRENAQAQADAIGAASDRDAALQALRALQVDTQTITDIQQGRPVTEVTGVIRSPIAGTVVEKSITPGQLLQAGSSPCFTIAELSRVWVMAQIFGSDIGSVHPGDHATVSIGPGMKRLTGTVTNVAAEVDPNTQSVLARVVVENPGDLLKKQMYVEVRIHSSDENTGLAIPVSAILRDDDNLPFVYVVRPDGSYARQHVTPGYRDGDLTVITEGLKVGEKVVVDGGIFLRFIQSQ